MRCICDKVCISLYAGSIPQALTLESTGDASAGIWVWVGHPQAYRCQMLVNFSIASSTFFVQIYDDLCIFHGQKLDYTGDGHPLIDRD